MRLILYAFLISMIFGFLFIPAQAASLSTEKSSYGFGDTIHISGKVTPVPENHFVILQIVNLNDSNIITADQFLPSSDGSFSKSYPVKGPKWTTDGTYSVKVFYQSWSEVNFSFQRHSGEEPESDKNLEEKTNPYTSDKLNLSSKKSSNENENIPKPLKQNLKIKIPGFPSLEKSPDHYFKRYDNEPSYQEWFDSQFPGLTIPQVVGYSPTHVNNFPESSKSPQSYIDRYNTEQSYQEWFDSQFPGKTIHEVLGYPKPVSIPNWVKENAEWWASGNIEDSDFIFGIEYMIEKNIIIIPNLPEPSESGGLVPNWVRNNAGWWAYGHISDGEFVSGLEFLVEKGIIEIN